MRFALISILFAATLSAFVRCEKQFGSTLERYDHCVEAIGRLSSLWDIFLRIPPGNTDERKDALDAFLKEHNNTMTVEYEWLASVLTGDISNPHTSLQLSLVQQKHKNLSSAESAVAEALAVYARAFKIEMNVLSSLNAEREAMMNLKDAYLATVVRAKANTVLVIENYKDNGWIQYFKKDIEEQMARSSNPSKILQPLLSFLRTAYPFRAWTIISYISNDILPFRWCVDAIPYIHRYFNKENTEIFIVHSPLKLNPDVLQDADKRLAALTASDWHIRRCHLKAPQIFNELNYRCGSEGHQSLMVFPLAPNQLQYVSTHPQFIRTRTVKRHLPIFCKQFYKAVIFS